MKLKFPKEITILSNKFFIKYDKTHNGGSFSISRDEIIIGTKSLKTNPQYTLGIISHEILEIIFVFMGARFDNSRTGDNFLFNFDHQTFENANQIYCDTIVKFIA
jgi:hypothetical protein